MFNAVVLAAEKVAEAAETASAVTETAKEEIPNLFACGMGVGVVFFGLICLVLVCLILGALFKGKETEAKVSPTATVTPKDSGVIENKQEIIAAVSAALAEELGSDVSAIKILSFKKM